MLGNTSKLSYLIRRSLSVKFRRCASSLGGPNLNFCAHRGGSSTFATRIPSSGRSAAGGPTFTLTPHITVVLPRRRLEEPSAHSIRPRGEGEAARGKRLMSHGHMQASIQDDKLNWIELFLQNDSQSSDWRSVWRFLISISTDLFMGIKQGNQQSMTHTLRIVLNGWEPRMTSSDAKAIQQDAGSYDFLQPEEKRCETRRRQRTLFKLQCRKLIFSAAAVA